MRRQTAINTAESLWRIAYRLLLLFGMPLVRLRLWRRGQKEAGYVERVEERFGHVPPHVPEGVLWVHAVSAGETIAAVPLIEALLRRYSHVPLLVTTTTPAGSGEVRRRLGERVSHCYAPWDTTAAVQRFMAAVQPRALILIETELWPNLLAACSAAAMPVALVNGRLSERSARGYGRIGALTRGMLQVFDLIGCQSKAHRERFIALGADPDRVRALGSVKYDVELHDELRTAAAELRERWGWRSDPVWIAASTHPGEETQVLTAYQMIRRDHPDAKLLLVPRHPVRAPEIEALIAEAGLASARQSGLQGTAPDVVIGDVMGSLLMLYGVADAAFVGGSLVPRGGHNPIEPALWGIPVLTGPYTFNFVDVLTEFRLAQAVVEVSDAETLGGAVSGYFKAPESARAVGGRGEALVAAQRGALDRTISALEPVLSLLRQ